MMGKASNRKRARQPEPAADVHAMIAAEAAAARAKDRLALAPAEETPALCGLLDSATAAIGNAAPPTFQHRGRTYYLRVSFAQVHLMVFESATAPEPLAYAVSGSSDEFGHTPYH